MKPDQGQLPGNAKCPRCGNGADGYTSTSDKEAPRTGDITICAYCAHVGVYEVKDDIVIVRSPTQDELKLFHKEVPDLQKKVNLIKRFIIEQAQKNN